MPNFDEVIFFNDNSVDRIEETNYILNEINNRNKDNSNVLIMYAASGVGKSTLTNRIFKNVNCKISIMVRTNPENDTEKVSEGCYLEKILNAFVNFFQINKNKYSDCTFEHYLSHNKNSIIKTAALEKMFSAIDEGNVFCSAGVAVSKLLLSRLFQLYEYNPMSKLILADRDSMIIASNYIEYILLKKEVCLFVDNLQNIDYYSLHLVIEFMANSGKYSFFIFEYTIGQKTAVSQLLKLAQQLNNHNLSVKLLELKALDSDKAMEALQMIRPAVRNDHQMFKEAQNYYLCRSNGNLQKLLDFSLQYNVNSILNETYDPTFAKINSVDNTSKYILGIIILHSGEIEKNILQTIVDASVDPVVINFEKTILKLVEEYEILNDADQIISIVHASVKDAWNNNLKVFSKFNLLAYRNCIRHYTSILNYPNGRWDTKQQALLFLLRVYAQYEPENLPHTISKISKLVSERISADNIWQYYSIFIEYIEGKEQNFLPSLYEIAEFCFNQNLYKNCLYVLQILDKIPKQHNEDQYFVLKVNCLEYLELHENAIELCHIRLRQDINDRQKYICYLLLMGCFRSINRHKSYLECVEKIRHLANYKSYMEYGIFLRLSEIYMERDEAIPFVKQSVDFFGKQELKLQEVQSRITYGFLLAVTGKYEEALFEFKYCSELLEPYNYWENVLLLNKSSVFMLKKQFGEEVGNMLKKAELSTSSPFDLLLILTMQLINSIESDNTSNVSYLLKLIEPMLEHETDKHLIALVSYDLFIAFFRLDKLEESKKYRGLAEKVKTYNTNVACHLEGKINEHTKALFETEWSIGFTFFWYVDYIRSDKVNH